MDAPHSEETEARACVALGVTGSIAAYKAADLTSRLCREGLEVHVLMTSAAVRLVQPRTFLTLSRNPVVTDLWETPAWQPEHVALAEKADVLVVAPATANFLGKLAHGIADDGLSTYALTHSGTVIVAPAMNPRMWCHPAVRANCRVLSDRGVRFVGPAAGRVACGEDGVGRMAPVDDVLAAVRLELARARGGPQAPPVRRVLVTAGPTQEALDPVRYLTNRSSGKMGFAIAAAAAAGGHETVLISGPCPLPTPPLCRRTDVRSAAQMAEAVRREFGACDVLIMAAAVADYRPATVAVNKLKKSDGRLALTLERTEDVLASVVGSKRDDQVVVGFAAETENVVENAREKMRRKSLDYIVANDVGRDDIGFGADANQVTILSEDREWTLPVMAKQDVASELLRIVFGKEGSG